MPPSQSGTLINFPILPPPLSMRRFHEMQMQMQMQMHRASSDESNKNQTPNTNENLIKEEVVSFCEGNAESAGSEVGIRQASAEEEKSEAANAEKNAVEAGKESCTAANRFPAAAAGTPIAANPLLCAPWPFIPPIQPFSFAQSLPFPPFTPLLFPPSSLAFFNHNFPLRFMNPQPTGTFCFPTSFPAPAPFPFPSTPFPSWTGFLPLKINTNSKFISNAQHFLEINYYSNIIITSSLNFSSHLHSDCLESHLNHEIRPAGYIGRLLLGQPTKLLQLKNLSKFKFE